ncbi:MAG: response regulator [Dehalococcoidales bacterium]|nr:response regulator [Dehalococcoidales bacterium]
MPKKMLIVEDEQDIRELIEAIFSEQDGYEIFCAGDSWEALSIIYSGKPDVIILDVNLPVLSGYSLCKMVKDDPAMKKTIILMLSGMAQRDDHLRALAAGADSYLTKPFSTQELMDTVQKLVEERLA